MADSEKPIKAKHPGGRPTKYSPELAEKICELIATTEHGYNRLSQMYDDLPHRNTVNIWRRKHQEFRSKYAQAKAEQIDCVIEEILEIADDGSNDYMKWVDEKTGAEGWRFNGEHVQRSRVRIDTRKWLASKLAPKLYGDKILIEQKTEENEKLKLELAELRAKLDAQNKKDY